MFHTYLCTCENRISSKFCHAAAYGIVGAVPAACYFLRRKMPRTSFGVRLPYTCVTSCFLCILCLSAFPCATACADVHQFVFAMVMDARMRAWASMHACVRVPSLRVFDCVCLCLCMGIAVCLVRVHLCGSSSTCCSACGWIPTCLSMWAG